MTSYDDIFIRDSKSETDNALPRADATTESPDIIPWGTATADDPKKLFSDDYDQNPGRSISYGETNYIYVRGKNFADGISAGAVYLYSAYHEQLSQPDQWQPLSTKEGNLDSAVAADQARIAVTEDPFVWTPARPDSQNPYVLIAAIRTSDYPNPVPGYAGEEPFVDWSANLGGVAARTIPVPPPPEPRKSYSFSALVELNNAEAMDVEVSLLPANGVRGDLVEFSFDKPGTSGPIALGSVPLSGEPGQTLSVDANVGANYSGTVTCKYSAKAGGAVSFPTLALTVFAVTGGGGGGHHGGGDHQLTKIVSYTLSAESD